MTYQTEFSLPRLGEGDGSGRIVNWLKGPGESFVRGETVLEVETDKAVVEIPAPGDGTLLEQIAGVDDVVGYRDPLALVKFVGKPPEAPAEEVSGERGTIGAAPSPAAPSAAPDPAHMDTRTSSSGFCDRVFASPFARKLARENGVALTKVCGTGKGGRIVARDIPHRADSAIKSLRGVGAPTQFDTREQSIEISSGQIFVRIFEPHVRHCDATMLLMHGLFGDVDSWSANATVLVRQGIAVVAMDLPAHGRSTCAADSFDDVVAAVAEAVRNAMFGPLSLVGHSFGGAVAARVARLPDLEIANLTLIAPVGLGTEIEQSFVDGMIRAQTTEALEREMRKLTLRPQPSGSAYAKALRERIAANAAQLERICQSTFHRGVQQIDIVSDLENIAVDACLIQGRNDAIVPWIHAMNAPARVALHLVPNVGHMPQWEASALVTDILARSCSR